MPRQKKVIRPVSIHLKLPEDLVARIELELFSEVEGRVPQGAKQAFFEGMAREYFQRKDAAQWSHACPVRQHEFYTSDFKCPHCGAEKPL